MCKLARKLQKLMILKAMPKLQCNKLQCDSICKHPYSFKFMNKFETLQEVWNSKFNALKETLVTREKKGRKTRKKWMASENLGIIKRKIADYSKKRHRK